MASSNFTTRVLLLAVDNSHEGRNTVSWILKNICRTGDKLHMLHIVPTAMVSAGAYCDVPAAYLGDDKAQKQVDEHAMKGMVHAFEKEMQANEVDCTFEVMEHSTDCRAVGRAVAARAKALGAVLIVPSHPKRNITSLICGSVTDYCLHHCEQPLLIVHIHGSD